MIKQTTHSTKLAEIKRNWHLVDATEQSLGRIASQVASLLRGKHKVNFTPQLDCGDFVVVTNASKVKLTGNKLQDKMYHRFTGYIGGMKEFNARHILERNPEFLITQAVRRMLPKGPLGRDMLVKMKVYPGAEHPHAAQQPQPFTLQ